MATTLKKPPYIETVGAQYICFNTPGTNGEYTSNYETEVSKFKTVKNVSVTEGVETTEIYASGEIYDEKRGLQYDDISEEVIAVDAATLHKMRGDIVDNGGLIFSGGPAGRPYFAYGKVVYLSGGKMRLDWYPKCKLVENSDEAGSSEKNFSEQTANMTIRAYPFNENKNTKTSVDSDVNWPENLTEEKFFTKPILTVEDLAAAATKGA